MKIAVLGDIHSNLPALEAVLEDLSSQGINQVYCVGDLVGYGPKPNEVIEIIKAKRIVTVMGNYDDAVAFNLPVCGCNYKSDAERRRGEMSLSWTKAKLTQENRAFLQELPEELSVSLGNRHLLLFHGSPRALNEYLYDFDDVEVFRDIIINYPADIYIFGHTHMPYIKKISDKLFINAGSVGLPKDGNPEACYAIVEISAETKVTFKRVSYPAEQTAEDIIKAGLTEEFAEIVRTGSPIRLTN